MTESPTLLPPLDGRVLVACPDARPPAYQAVVGLARAGLLEGFLTSYYYGGSDFLTKLGLRFAPRYAERVRNVLRRRHHPAHPRARVLSAWSYDCALQFESRLRADRKLTRRSVGALAHGASTATWLGHSRRHRPEALLVFQRRRGRSFHSHCAASRASPPC